MLTVFPPGATTNDKTLWTVKAFLPYGRDTQNRDAGCFFDNVSLPEFHSLHCPEQHALPYNTNEAVIQYLLASHSEPVRPSFNTNWKTVILAPCFMLLREGMPWCCLLVIIRWCVVCYPLSRFTSGREPYPSASMPMHCPTHIMSTSSPLCKNSVGFAFVFFRHDLTFVEYRLHSA